MKRIFKLIACMLAAMTLFTFTACGESKCSHSYTSVITKEATCKVAGIRTYTCGVCGDSYTEDIAKLTTHTYTSVITKEATCNETGIKTYTCGVCGHNYTTSYSMPELTASEVFENSKNSVGEIITYDKNGSEYALGTGFSYSSNGKIITNYHVIEGAYSAKITINGINYTIKSVLAYDKNIDLAVLKIDATNLKVLDICKSNHSVGKAVYAFGSSKGLTATFSQGIITCADRELDGVHYVQHDAATSSGNSGGPLINQYGEIIGVHTMTIKDSQNLNFAISVKELDNLTYGNPLTLAQFYEKECDVFTKVKNYVMAKGSYDSSDKEYTITLGYTYSSDYSTMYTRKVSYNVVDDEICLMFFIDADNLVSIYIDEVDGVYNWTYVDIYEYYMIGVLYASTYTPNHLLGYSSNNISSSSLRSAIRELASSMASLLITYTNIDFAEIGVTAADLGFINY